MSQKDFDTSSERTGENCMDRCRFKAKNCWMQDDGTWDCSTKLEDCFDQCHIS